MTSKLVVNTIEADTGISSVSFASSISMSSTSKFHFSNSGIDIGADTNINRPASGVLAFNINSSEKVRITSSGHLGVGDNNPDTRLSVTAASGTDVVGKFTSTDANAWIQFRDNSTTDTAVMVGASGDNLLLRAGSNTRVYITSAGDLSLRTTTQNAYLGLTANSTAINLTLGSTSGTSPRLYLKGTGNGQSDAGDVFIGSGTGGIVNIRSAELMKFEVNSDNSTLEALRIHSNGNLTQTGSGNVVHYINTGNNSGDNSTIAFGDSADADAGYINYDHGTNAFQIRTNGASNSVVITNEGEMQLSGDANPVLSVNRGGSNTTNINIKYNGSTRAQLSAASNGFEISAVGSTAPIQFFTNGSERLRITNGGLDPSTDAVTDLGNSSKRFRDLYLSSGIFLGGTTSSNELEDYEEGTYVPSTNTGLTLNSSYNTFSYIKIGRCCTIRGLFYPSNNPSGGHTMTMSLPFASYNYTGSGASIAGAGGSGTMYRSISGADAGVAIYISDNVSNALFYKNGSNGGAWSPVYNNDWNNAMEIYIDVTYFTV